MSDIKDRLKFNSGTDKVTKSVADAVSEVLNSGQTPKSRFEQQAELMGYPSQDKPEVAESFTKELQELKKAVKDSKKDFVAKARKAKENGDKTFVFAGKEYPCTVGEAAPDMGDEKGKKKLKKDLNAAHCSEDASNDKSDDGEGLDKVDKKAVKKKFKNRKDKDIDNDGDVDSSDKFLHKKRKAISKAIDKNEDASETKYDARSKSFKETLRRLGYVKEKSLIYTNKKSGK
tara:strand:- start:49 stop:741 length:693 start_codon:yes stop_codon:yes gene_type:complete